VIDGPRCPRPSYVSLIPGGRQDFPVDPKGDAYRSSLVREQAKREGRTLVRRRPSKGTN
jgi:hypothetical protein